LQRVGIRSGSIVGLIGQADKPRVELDLLSRYSKSRPARLTPGGYRLAPHSPIRSLTPWIFSGGIVLAQYELKAFEHEIASGQ